MPQLLSLRSRAREPQLLSPRAQILCSTTREATTMRSLHTTRKSNPCSPQLERKPTCSNKDPMQPKINKNKITLLKKKNLQPSSTLANPSKENPSTPTMSLCPLKMVHDQPDFSWRLFIISILALYLSSLLEWAPPTGRAQGCQLHP